MNFLLSDSWHANNIQKWEVKVEYCVDTIFNTLPIFCLPMTTTKRQVTMSITRKVSLTSLLLFANVVTLPLSTVEARLGALPRQLQNSLIPLAVVGNNGSPASNFPLGECEGKS